jgi:hypothetical protein
MFNNYQALHDQKPGVVLSFFSEHLCLALNDFLFEGLSRLISILGSPKLTLTTLPLAFLTYTDLFFGPSGV